ncbi:MAG: pili assembly chaperone [Gammaproteobacteria bacterium]|nr:pili assembly chaperone [Gammaproteobacteria bacterium]
MSKIAETRFIMKRSIVYPNPPATVIAICITGLCTLTSLNLQADDAQADLLATTLTIRFPKRIQILGEAVRYLLQRSGYRLAKVESIGPDEVNLFALPLPAVHRSLGPMTLRDALRTLVGPTFHLVQDPVHRLITFERCSPDQLAVQDNGTLIDREVAQDEK